MTIMRESLLDVERRMMGATMGLDLIPPVDVVVTHYTVTSGAGTWTMTAESA